MIQNYKEYIWTFADIAESHPGILGFAIDYSDRVSDLQRSNAVYPILEVVPPSFGYILTEQGRQQKVYNCGFSLLQHVQKDDWEGQESVMASMESLLDQIVELLVFAEILTEETKMNAYPIRNVRHDNLWGWGMEFSIEADRSFCYKPAEWKPIFRFIPVFESGETVLSIFVDGQQYSAVWTDESQADERLKEIAAAITADDAGSPGIHARLDRSSLLIYGLDPGVSAVISFSETGHSWLDLKKW